MKRLLFVVPLAFAAALLSFNCGEETTTGPGSDFVAGPYSGTQACKLCHETKYTSFMLTGHPYKLNPVQGQAPTYPFSEVPNPPAGYTWNDVKYVIGGYGWKARFIGNDGNIITGKTQYNLATKGWVDYHPGETKPYDCGGCHTTGFDENGHQGGLPGIEGTWAMPGVQCEACHGPGDKHIEDPNHNGMTVNRDASACGACHIRGEKYLIPAKGGFIRHHEQYNEFYNSVHARFLNCDTCHDPHTKVHYGEDGITRLCSECHNNQVNVTAMASFDCTACHMPPAAKSAVGDTGKFTGDVASHLFRINVDKNAEQFYTIGSDEYSYFYINLDFACLRGGCHNTKTRTWAENNAGLIHG